MSNYKFKSSLNDNCDGSSLLLVMFAIALIGVFVGVAINATSNVARISTRAGSYVTVEKATEGAVEYGFGVWKARTLALSSPPLSQNAINANPITGPTFPNINYASAAENGPVAITALDEYGNPAPNAVRIYTNLQGFPGYKGFAYNYLVSAKMRQTSGYGTGATAGVKRMAQYVEVPMFQSMFFFEHDLTIAQPAQMIVGGLIHTNANLYLMGSNYGSLTVSGDASYAGSYSDTTAPPDITSWGPWDPSATQPPIYPDGKNAQLSLVSRFEPLGDKPASVLDPFQAQPGADIKPPQDTDNNPNNDSFRELIERPNTNYSDPPEISKRRLYNKAGIEINISKAAGSPAPVKVVTITAKNGTQLNPTAVQALQAAVTATTPIFDQREGKTITTDNVDMSQVTATLNSNGVSGFNGMIYIYDTTPANFDSNTKAVRLQNGGILPSGGLTVASEDPVYIQGDYNTGTKTDPSVVPANATGNPSNTDSPVAPGYTKAPAAVIADAVMLLSNNWNDANASKSLNNRLASNTTYNTAIMSGFMPSGFDPNNGPTYGYSGGAINFPRFLEQWTGQSCTYYGSMVELFQSQTFTGEWDTGNIYNPPKRRWNYDTLFDTNPPPGAVNAVVLARGTWAKF